MHVVQRSTTSSSSSRQICERDREDVLEKKYCSTHAATQQVQRTHAGIAQIFGLIRAHDLIAEPQPAAYPALFLIAPLKTFPKSPPATNARAALTDLTGFLLVRTRAPAWITNIRFCNCGLQLPHLGSPSASSIARLLVVGRVAGERESRRAKLFGLHAAASPARAWRDPADLLDWIARDERVRATRPGFDHSCQ